MLSGCLGRDGGGSGGGSTSSNKKPKPCTTPISNAKERGLLWNSTTKKYSTICKVVSCNAGYVKNTGENSCDIPEAGKYADNLGRERDCSPITTEWVYLSFIGVAGGFDEFLANMGAVDSATGCDFSCNAGFVKSGRTCNIPDPGKYADGGIEKSCDTPTGATGGFKEFLDNIKGVNSASGCNFSCKSGYVKSAYTCTGGQTCPVTNGGGLNLWDTNTDDFSTTCTVETCYAGYDSVANQAQCGQTPSGFFSLAGDKTRTTCPAPPHSSATTTTGLSSADGCYTCDGGYLKNTASSTCDFPSKGKYVDASGTEVTCNPITTLQGGFDEFLDNTRGVSSAHGCNFSCRSGYVKSVSNYTCTQGQTCPIASGVGFQQISSDPCQVVDCNSGFVKNTGADSCDIPDTGKYADNLGREQDCDDPTGDTGGFNTFLPNTGGVSSASGCGFSCNTGFMKDSSSRECNFPFPGNYVTAGGTESSCTDITGLDTWLEGAAADQDSCPFSCSSGYTVSGRTCRKARPQTLALGEDTSRILFDNGEVEAWGKVSASHWRSHIKENLGGNTPQALVSGGNHQCIILKNGNLNHGRLMCWGQNGNDRLGVGDTNPRTTPTAVTASILGDAEGGVPNTVKSVAGGYQHTCALLSDDTVVCWGDNSNGQIGGGASGSNRVISGSAGDPLSGGTASRIAAGTYHTCAVLSDKSVQCWGQNYNGQTGGGAPSFNVYGQTGGGVPSLGVNKTATEIAAGATSSCAILNDASVVCWGVLGSPSLLGKTATKITMGWRYACALLNDKSVKCWGNNFEGQIGGGTAGSDRVLRGTSGDPLGGQTAIEIAARSKHTCAIMESDHSVKCWGANVGFRSTSFYGKIVGEVAMTGGSNGTGTSTGETATLTATSIPRATFLDSDASGKICKIELSGGTLGTPWVAKNYTTPLTYNTGGSTVIADVIDSLIAAIGSPVKLEKQETDVTLSRKGNDRIVATVNTAVFDGMTLTIFHDDDGGNCSRPIATSINLIGGSGAAKAEGLWVISNGSTGTGDTAVNLDSVHIDLGNSNLTKEEIADKIVADVNGGSWAGKQNVDLPYTATKVQNSDNSNCPIGNYCVLFERVRKEAEGNYGIPFGDRDYSY